MTTQPRLIPETRDEVIDGLREALGKFGKHTLYCGWDSKCGFYSSALGCTCGLDKAKETER